MTNSLVPAAIALPAPFQGPSTSDASSIDIGRWIGAARQRRFLVGGVFIALFALVATVLLSQEKRYTSTAVIQINMHERSAADVLPDQYARDTRESDASKVETEVAVLKSRGLAEDVMKHVEGARGAARKGPKSDDPVDAFLSGEKVEHVGQSYIINVSYAADTPQAAATVANAFVQRFRAWKERSSIKATDETNAWLDSTLAQLRSQAAAADEAVAKYRADHNMVPAGPSTISEQAISEISQQLVTAKAAEAEALARYDAARAQMLTGANGANVGEALASPVVSRLRERRAEVSQSLAELKTRFDDQYPDVVTAANQLADIDSEIQNEIKRIISNLKVQAGVASNRSVSLQKSLDRANNALVAQESASVKLNDLLRTQEAARAAYLEYLGRYKRTSAEQSLPQNEVRVVTSATPVLKPSSPNPPKAIALAFGIALAGAAGVLFATEVRRKGFDDASEVEREAGVRGLPLIPMLSSTSRAPKVLTAPAAYVVQRPLSTFAESFRALRTSVIASRNDKPVKVVAFTSALPGEGKTTTSICFGRVAALGDIKTVIVDCDLRRRALDRVIGKKAEVGLLDVLSGRATLDQALILDIGSNAYFMPIGSSNDVHKSVFDSPNMDRLLAELRQRFGLVVLDCPPVLVLADAGLIAQKADATVLLSHWRRTPRAAVGAAIRVLAEVGAFVAGLCLTQVDLEKLRAAGYGSAGYPYLQDYRGYFAE